MSDSPSPRVDAERNRKLLLDAAAEALSHDSDASMGDVAATAGLTRATLYRHFGSREHLLEALRADALASAREAIENSRLDDGSALDALRRVVSAITALGGKFQPLLANGADEDPAFLKERGAVFAPVQRVIQRGQAENVIRADLSPQWVVAALTALLSAAVRSRGENAGDDPVFELLAFGLVAPDQKR